MLVRITIISSFFFGLPLRAVSFTPAVQPFALSSCLQRNQFHNNGLLFMKEGKNNAAVPTSESRMETYADFRDQLEALFFLSGISGDEDLSKSAQEVFDRMFEKWFEDEDDDDLEPDTDIYNLLLSVYSNCGQMTTAEKILERMETGKVDGVPTANLDTYLTIMSGWGISGDVERAEDIIRRLQSRYKENGDESIQPSTQVFNSLLKILLDYRHQNSPERAENLLRQMVASGCEDGGANYVPKPNTDTFRYVIESYIRTAGKANYVAVVEKVDELLALMDECEHLNTNHHVIVNTKIKLLSQSKKGGISVAEEAEALLFGMIDRCRTGSCNDKTERPNAASFIHTINSWSNTRSNKSGPKVNELLNILEQLYEDELKRGEDCENLKTDARVYNAVIKTWARSNAKNKAIEAEALLKRLQSLYQSTGDEDYSPNQTTYNHIINAATFTKGNEEHREGALSVMVETFNLIRTADNVQPNHVTYGLFLKGCSNLIADKKKRESIVENVFRKASRDGFVSDFVIDSLLAATSADFAERLLGGEINDDGIRIPNEWARNVKSY